MQCFRMILWREQLFLLHFLDYKTVPQTWILLESWNYIWVLTSLFSLDYLHTDPKCFIYSAKPHFTLIWHFVNINFGLIDELNLLFLSVGVGLDSIMLILLSPHHCALWSSFGLHHHHHHHRYRLLFLNPKTTDPDPFGLLLFSPPLLFQSHYNGRKV